MAFPLTTTRVIGPGLVALLGANNYHINSMALQLEFITAVGIGLTQLIITVRGTISGTGLWSTVYGYQAAAAGTTNFNLPIPIAGMDCMLPRGDGIEINMLNGANVLQCAISVNLYGTKL